MTTNEELNKLVEQSSNVVKNMVAIKQDIHKKKNHNMENVDSKLVNELKELSERKTNTATTTVDAGNASELVPGVQTLTDVFDDSSLERQYAWMNALVAPRTDLTRGDNNDLPILTDHGNARGIPQATTANFHDKSAAFNTVNSTSINIQTKKLGNQVDITDYLERQGVVKALSIAQLQDRGVYLNSIAEIILNSDLSTGATGNINSDDQLASTTFPDTVEGYVDIIRNFSQSLRFTAINAGANVGTKDIGAPAGVNDIFEVAALLKTGVPSDRLILMDNQTYFAYMAQDDFKDASKNGKGSTIATGALTNIAGMDLFVTDLLRHSEADGKLSGVTPANNVLGNFVVLDKNVMQRGWDNNIISDVEGDLFKGVTYKSVARYGQGSLDGANGRKVAAGINVTI